MQVSIHLRIKLMHVQGTHAHKWFACMRAFRQGRMDGWVDEMGWDGMGWDGQTGAYVHMFACV